MKLLYVYGNSKSISGSDVIQALKNIGYETDVYPNLMENVERLNDDEVDALTAYISEHAIDCIVSIHFILNASLASYKTGVKYISVIWDSPYLCFYNVLGRLDNLWVSTFDKLDRERFLQNGVKHVLYQPLSINDKNLMEWSHDIQETLQGNYIHDISFIGNLYDKSNGYDLLVDKIPVNIQYYFNSIFEEAAFKWDGVNRIYGKTGQEMLDYIKLVSPEFAFPNRQDVEDVLYFENICLVRKIANIERIAVLNLLAENHNVTLYTGSQENAEKMLHNVNIGPPVETGKATALVFAGSKINLNISLKGIEGGTPQRIMDVMGAGGFVLSSYCEETAELFEENKEIVFFRTPEELLEKVDYYLAHDMERRQIARAGYEKVINCYTYEKKMKELLEWVEKEE